MRIGRKKESILWGWGAQGMGAERATPGADAEGAEEGRAKAPVNLLPPALTPNSLKTARHRDKECYKELYYS